jgi:hypothetical protein
LFVLFVVASGSLFVGCSQDDTREVLETIKYDSKGNLTGREETSWVRERIRREPIERERIVRERDVP